MMKSRKTKRLPNNNTVIRTVRYEVQVGIYGIIIRYRSFGVNEILQLRNLYNFLSLRLLPPFFFNDDIELDSFYVV